LSFDDKRGIAMSEPSRNSAPAPAAAWPGAGAFTQEELELARLARALGHPARVRILRFLAARQTCIGGDIVDELGLAQSTVSEHLRILREACLIRGEIERPRICYCVTRETLQRLRDLIAGL
jgi:ArsR family transcriptional regulator, arsenate/arsenite/antimonite-responsive transcriptional repressor